MSPLDAALERCRAATTERARAEAEAAIWDAAPERGEKSNPAAVVGQYTGGSVYAIRHRRALLLVGPLAGPLWARVEEGMPPYTATKVARLAQKRARKYGGAAGEHLVALLADYDALPVRHTRWGDRAARVGSLSADLSGDDAGLYVRLRAMVTEYVRRELPGCDVMRADEIRREFESDVRAALGAMRARVRAEKDAARAVNGDGGVSRAQLRAACEELALDLPRSGATVDGASKRYRQLARTLHPDVAPGQEEAFRRLTEAYEVVGRHNAAVEKRREGEHHGNDGH